MYLRVQLHVDHETDIRHDTRIYGTADRPVVTVDVGSASLFFIERADIRRLMCALRDAAKTLLDGEPQAAAVAKYLKDTAPWPVAEGTDTTGWTDSQKLGEQPPPGWVDPRDRTEAPMCRTQNCGQAACKIGDRFGIYCRECLGELEKEIPF